MRVRNLLWIFAFAVPLCAQSADLQIFIATDKTSVKTGEHVQATIRVENAGPETATQIDVLLQPTAWVLDARAPEDWTCANALLNCRTNAFASGAKAEIVVTLLAPSSHAFIGSTLRLDVNVQGQGDTHHDNNTATATLEFENDVAPAFVIVASPGSWARVLLPLASQDVPGANGALWRTKTTMLIADTNPAFELSPHPCEYIILHCFGGNIPLGVPFDPADPDLLLDASGRVNGGSQFFYVRSENEPKLRVNSRVFDVTRESDTAGSEIPIPRDDDFSSATISLLGIPVRAESRYTLRVYDYDGVDGAHVTINVFADAESTPRASFVGVLRNPDRRVTTLAALPVRPAYLQIDPTQLASLDGADMMRIDIAPQTLDGRIWAFVSVTDNDTHHVTTFSSQ